MKRIRIGIDAGDNDPQRYIGSGIQRLVSSFTDYLSQHQKQNRNFNYYYFSDLNTKKVTSYVNPVRLPKKFFSSLFMPLKCFTDRIQVFLGFSGIIPSLIRLFSKSIVFIHDFGFYDYSQFYPTSDKLKWKTGYAILGANKIIVFSDHIRNQLIEKFPSILKQKIIRIYPGTDHFTGYFKIKPNEIPDFSYFLYVGVIKKIKNIEKLLENFSLFLKESQQNKYKLVLIGRKEKLYWDNLIQIKAYSQCKKNLIFLNQVSERELYIYYKYAYAVLNNSYAEGFCYPVVEALSLGKKVITNKIPLYNEFAPFFPGLFISRSGKEFVNEMKKESKKERPVVYPIKKNPFKWSTFSSQLLTVIDNLSS